MLINLRNALMTGKRLPYDAEVEYLESSGTQWIDIDASEVATASRYVCSGQYMVGANQSMIWSHGYRGVRVYATKIGFVTGRYRTTDTTVSYNVQCTSSFDASTLKGILYSGDGTELANVDLGTSSASGVLRLFAASPTATGYVASSSRISTMQVYDASGNILLDLIPVRKGTVGYLYDRVTGKLFGNAGTGDFVLGPDVVPVEYIESHGMEYINTGIVATNAHGVRIDIATAQKSGNTNTRIFGTHEGNTRFGFALFGTGEPTGNDAFFGWNAATSFVATIPQRFVASLNYQNDRKAIFNGTTYISSLGTLGSLTQSIYLLNANYGGAPFANQYVVGKLYGAEITVGSDVANHYIPVRVGTEGAAMDVLTRRIYRNAGTGAFGYGNDLPYPIPAA